MTTDIGEIYDAYGSDPGYVILRGGSKYKLTLTRYANHSSLAPSNGDRVEAVFDDSDDVVVLRLIARGWRGLVIDHGEAGARKELARKLRLFADQVERGTYPDVYACECAPGQQICEKDIVERISVTLSHPWGG